MTRASDTAEWLRYFAKTQEREHRDPLTVESLRNAADLIEELAKDGERLDWLESQKSDTPLMIMSGGDWYWFTESDYGWEGAFGTPRAAIDAAMKGEE